MFFVACSQVWSLANFMIGETERQLSNRSQIVDLWIVRSAPPWVHQKWGETSTHCLSSIPRWGPTYQVLPSLTKSCQALPAITAQPFHASKDFTRGNKISPIDSWIAAWSTLDRIHLESLLDICLTANRQEESSKVQQASRANNLYTK